MFTAGTSKEGGGGDGGVSWEIVVATGVLAARVSLFDARFRFELHATQRPTREMKTTTPTTIPITVVVSTREK